jgi:hypothetical protein
LVAGSAGAALVMFLMVRTPAEQRGCSALPFYFYCAPKEGYYLHN